MEHTVLVLAIHFNHARACTRSHVDNQSFCLSEQYLRSLEAPLVQNSTWRGKSNASIFKLSVHITNNNTVFVFFNDSVHDIKKSLYWYRYLARNPKNTIQVLLRFCFVTGSSSCKGHGHTCHLVGKAN